MAALATAGRVHRVLGGTDAHTGLHSVTELEVIKATRRKREPERCVAGLQINYWYMLQGLPLIGPGARPRSPLDGTASSRGLTDFGGTLT
jgi:hypothetical protein